MRALCVGNGPSSDLIPWRDLAADYDVCVGVNWRVQHPAGLTHWVGVSRPHKMPPFLRPALEGGVQLYAQRSFWEGRDPELAAELRLYRHLRPSLDPIPVRGDCTQLYQWGVMVAALHLAYNLGCDELHVTGMDNGWGYSKDLDPQYNVERIAGHQYVGRDAEWEQWQLFIYKLRGHGVKFKALTPTPIEPLFYM